MDQKKIGSFFKELRKEKGVTQEQLAEMLNIAVRTVSRWEIGVPYIKSYAVALQAMNWDMVSAKNKEKVEKATARLAQKLSGNRKPYVGIGTRFIFKVMGMMQKAGMGSSPMEKEYWKSNGWLDKKRPWRD